MVETTKKKILITGARGLLGSALCKVYAKDDKVLALGKNDFDLTNKSQMKAKTESFRPDIVINCAAISNVDLCETNQALAYNVNSTGPKDLALICKDFKVALLHISTDYVFDGKKHSAYNEDDEANPLSIYAKSKRQGEIFVEEILKEHYIIRTSWIFGKKGKDFVSEIINRVDKKENLRIVDNKFSNPTYCLDLANSLKNIINLQPEYGIYNISNFGSCSWYDYANEIVKLYNKNFTKIEKIKFNDLGLKAPRPLNSALDTAKITKALGVSIRPWQKALKEYICQNFQN